MAEAPLRYEHYEIQVDERGLPVRLGRGGMGAAFRAYDTRLRRPVALKIINERALANRAMRSRFFNEARAAAEIDHPNVARVLHLCEDDAAECFFAMELIEGESLADLVARRGPLPAGEALALLRPVVAALGALAVHRLIHRDIKQENIMITRAGVVKLIDFGVAKPFGGGSERFDLVETDGQFVGSIHFASPEQVLGKDALDPRSDFYSLGATLWHALTGAPPFTGSRYEVQEAHLHEPPDFSKMEAQPAPVVALLARLLAKRATDRPADVAALLAEWDAALRAVPAPHAEAHFPETPAPGAPAETFTLLDPAPTGFALPPPPARLAAEGDAWLAVREISYEVSAALRARFLAAAREASDAPLHASLLAVRAVREAQVCSEWRRGISAAKLLSLHRGGIPLAAVLGWLPAVAEAVDFAQARGFSQLGFAPEQWLVSFADLDPGETAIQRASRSPGQWGVTRVALDPLAGFNAALTFIQTDSGHTEAPVSEAALHTAADFLAALARTLHQLLGGHVNRADSPLTSLGEPQNELLRAAAERRSPAASAAEWAAAFLRAGADERPRTKVPLDSANRPSTSAKRKLPALRTVAAAAVTLGIGLVYFLHWRPSDVEPRTNPAPTRATTPSPLTTPAPVPTVSTALIATSEAPFKNSLGMEFVPVPIGGSVPDQRVLFCRHETRRRDFAPFVSAGGAASEAWQAPEISGVKMPAGDEAGSHPVINVTWAEAVAFCDWLTTTERKSGHLRANESYRLPTDHEWSCAAGIGAREDSHLPPKAKSGSVAGAYAWGTGFPPRPEAGEKLPGNYAGEESRGTWAGIVEGYDDGFVGTAPVGSFAPNVLGLHDLGGNAWEWCQETWNRGEDGQSNAHVLRGASCVNSLPDLLNLSYRKAADDGHRELCGFRCVLAVELN